MTPRAADPEERGERLGDRGMTVVEMLVALVVAGLLSAGMFTLLFDQNRFYGATSDRDFAEETLRGTSQLAATELRMVTGGDVIAAKPDSIAVRADVLTGYVCHVTTTDDVLYYVHHTAPQAALSGPRGTAYLDPFSTSFVYRTGFDATGTASSTARTECEDAGAPAGKAASRYRRVAWSGTLPEPGAMLRVFRGLSYYFAPSGVSSGLALWRNGSELAGPFSSANAGFRYRVCTSSTSCSWHNSVNDASDQRNIRRVVLEARALGDGANRHNVALDLDYDITLRNYIQN